MIYIFYGTDREAVLKKTDSLLKSLFIKNPDLSYEKFDLENFEISKLRDLSQSHSLFGNKTVVVLDNILEENEEVFSSLAYLSSSENIFIIRENKILKPELKKLEKHAEKIEELNEQAGKKENFNVFTFGDAVGERNKRNAWILYQKGIFSGLVPEQLFWIVVSQVRNMLTVTKTKNASETGLHPFVYGKARGFLKNYKEKELIVLSEKLVIGYHLARRGEGEVETLLEKTLLSL
jgi:DNA polymerase III delta subunit